MESNRKVGYYEHVYKVEPIVGTKEVQLTQTISRHIFAIDKSICIKLGGSIDEKFGLYPSRFNYCRISVPGYKEFTIGNGINIFKTPNNEPPGIVFESEEPINIGTEKPVIQQWQTVSAGLRNDNVTNFFGTQSEYNYGEVIVPDNFDWKLEIASTENQVVRLENNRIIIEGILQPLAGITLRWWDKFMV